MTDRTMDASEIEKLTTYEIDDRRLFCRHCGRAAWRHRRSGRVLICEGQEHQAHD